MRTSARVYETHLFIHIFRLRLHAFAINAQWLKIVFNESECKHIQCKAPMNNELHARLS